MVFNKVNGSPGVLVIRLFPHTGDCFDLSVEVEARAAVEVQVSVEAASAAGKGEHWKRHRDGHVNADL